jgi:hypothetical protein
LNPDYDKNFTKKAFCIEGTENGDVRFETDESLIDTEQLSEFCFETTNDVTFDGEHESQNTEYLRRCVSEMDFHKGESDVGEMVEVGEMVDRNDSPSPMLSYKKGECDIVKFSQFTNPCIFENPGSRVSSIAWNRSPGDMVVEPEKSRKFLERISVLKHSSSINLGNLGTSGSSQSQGVMFRKQGSNPVSLTNGQPPVWYKVPAVISWGSKINVGSNKYSSVIPIEDQAGEQSMSELMESE